MHVSGKLAFNLNDSFFIGIKNCDFIALEIDPDLMLTDLVNSKILKSALAANANLNNFNDRFYEHSFAVKEINNKALANLLSYKNDVINTLLYRSNVYTVNKEEDTYLDLFIFQSGKKLGKKIIGLETFEGTMNMYAQQLKAESELDEKEKNKVNYSNAIYSQEKLEEAYRRGDIDLLDSMSKSSFSKMAYKYMILERNKIMFNGIDSLIKAGAAVFTGVGAAHLGGEEGILNALRKNGYTVNPVKWQALKPSKLKTQIKKIVVAAQLTKQYSLDSSFSVEVPGKIQSLQNVGQEDMYLATDMTNGSYYAVSSINHNGFINKHDKKYWAQKVDSLLYENIDGTITLKQESVTENGDICFLVNSKTRRGDIERYKIIITPFKIFVLKVGGNGSHANGKEANQFLNSAKLYPKALANNLETACTYRFTLDNTFIYNGGNKNIGKHIAVSNDGTKFNMLLVVQNKETKYIEEDTFELNYIVQKAAEKNQYEITQLHLNSDKNSASFEWKKDNEVYKGKLVVNGPHYYFLLDNTGDESFINSFTLNRNAGGYNYNMYTDTSMLFSVKLVDVPEINELSSLIVGNQKKKPNDAEFKREYYTSKATKETIQLSYEKLNQYQSYTNLDSLWSKSIYDATDMANPVISHKAYSSKKGANILDCKVEVPENAHQYLRVRIVQKGKYIYTLNALCAKDKSSPFVDTFYNTFSLLDSNYGLAATEPKISLLLKDIFSIDSVTRTDARDKMYILNTANIKPNDFKTIKEAIQKSAQSDLDMDNRIILIKSLKNIKTPECINWLKTYYSLSKDTPAFQFAVLYGLAAHQTMPATLAFAELIKKETPILEENYSFNNCFNQFDDSLELIAKVAPQLIFLLDFDEYKERMVELLADLKYKNLISTNLYLANKTKFLNGANIELKKHIAGLQNNNETNSYNDYSNYNNIDDYVEGEETYYDNESLTIDSTLVEVYTSILFDYAVLLQPFYAEPNVKSFFDKIIKNGAIELQLSAGALLLKNNIPVENSNWEKWAADVKTRMATYKLLNNIGKLEKFPPAYKTIDSIARSQAYTYNVQNSSQDSVIYVLKEQNVNSKKGMGTLFIYKKYLSEKQSWNWSYLYLKDDGNFNIKQLGSRNFTNEYEAVTDEKIVEKIKLSIRLLDRAKCEEVNFYNINRDVTED